MTIARLEISRMGEDGEGYYVSTGVECFLIDTARVLDALRKEELHYSKREMEELLRAIELGETELPEGSQKFSLYDTPWEHELVRPTDAFDVVGLTEVKTYYRNVCE